MTTAVDVFRLSLTYGKRPVLKDLSFSVNCGEFFFIIGPNGSGKTSLIKSIAQNRTDRYLGTPLVRLWPNGTGQKTGNGSSDIL